MSQIRTKFIQDNAITTAKINNDAVTNDKIADNAVNSDQIASNAVVEAKIADNAVTNSKLADNAVNTAEIAADAVTGAKIRLNNDQYLRARNAADNANLEILKVKSDDETQLKSPSFSLDSFYASWWVGNAIGLIKNQSSGSVDTLAVSATDHANDSTDTGASILISTGNKSGASSTNDTGSVYNVTGWNEGSGNSGQVYHETGYVDSGNSGSIENYTGDSASGASGQIILRTGAVNGGSADSGGILLRTGNNSGSGKAGDLEILLGAAGVKGNIRTVANLLQIPNHATEPTLNLVDGGMYWNSATDTLRIYDATLVAFKDVGGSSGANTTLSNLTSPTAINQDLIFDKASAVLQTQDETAAATDSADLEIATGDASGAGANSGDLVIKTGSADSAGAAGNISIDAGSNGTDFGTITLNAKTFLVDGQSNGGTIQFSNFVEINAGGMNIINLTDPVNAQDAATKNYVDNASVTPEKETFVLSAGDITNQYIDLANVAKTDSIHFLVDGAGVLLEGASYEYTVNYTGGAGGNTRISFANDIATGGPAALIAGDVVQVVYLR